MPAQFGNHEGGRNAAMAFGYRVSPKACLRMHATCCGLYLSHVSCAKPVPTFAQHALAAQFRNIGHISVGFMSVFGIASIHHP